MIVLKILLPQSRIKYYKKLKQNPISIVFTLLGWDEGMGFFAFINYLHPQSSPPLLLYEIKLRITEKLFLRYKNVNY